MGNTNTNGNWLVRRDRRREVAIVFYFIFGFIMIRIWILLIESHDVLIESIGGIVTFLLIVVLGIRYRMQRNHQLMEEERLRQLHPEVNPSDLALLQALFRTPLLGLSQDVINSLYCFKYSEDMDKMKAEDGTELLVGSVVAGNGAVGQDLPSVAGDLESQIVVENSVPSTCCSICLAEYALDDDLMRLPCRHAYHKTCVTEWLQRHTQCPLCKQDVLGLLEQQLIGHHQLDRLQGMGASEWTPAAGEEIRSATAEDIPISSYPYTELASPTTPTAPTAPTASAPLPNDPSTPNSGSNPMQRMAGGESANYNRI